MQSFSREKKGKQAKKIGKKRWEELESTRNGEGTGQNNHWNCIIEDWGGGESGRLGPREGKKRNPTHPKTALGEKAYVLQRSVFWISVQRTSGREAGRGGPYKLTNKKRGTGGKECSNFRGHYRGAKKRRGSEGTTFRLVEGVHRELLSMDPYFSEKNRRVWKYNSGTYSYKKKGHARRATGQFLGEQVRATDHLRDCCGGGGAKVQGKRLKDRAIWRTGGGKKGELQKEKPCLPYRRAGFGNWKGGHGEA